MLPLFAELMHAAFDKLYKMKEMRFNSQRTVSLVMYNLSPPPLTQYKKRVYIDLLETICSAHNYVIFGIVRDLQLDEIKAKDVGRNNVDRPTIPALAPGTTETIASQRWGHLLSLSFRGPLNAITSWRNLVDLTILQSGSSPMMIYRIFDQCPNLSTVIVEGDGCTEDTASEIKSLPRITLRHLNTLRLSFISNCVPRARRLHEANITRTISPLLSRLVLPVLKHLHIQASLLAIDYRLPATLQASLSCLEHLTLERVLFDSDDLYNLLATSPSITTLRLTAGAAQLHAYAETIGLLAYNPAAHTNVLPNLRSLHVEDNFSPARAAVVDEWELGVLSTIKSRFWIADDSEGYPHRQGGLSRLDGATVQWNRKGVRSVARFFRRLDRAGLPVLYCAGYSN
ncbi:hypothetical protein D9615_008576 [Tricholomella constricta]|uniref:Uncharacterized protein n=1 Tax=Tricholomella constricta TaxID=117010 RepID=A0A8H5H4J2_9AGAR|nr:hypothetical protein D9615_008576 [Tricholomella constricta]